MKSDIRTFCYAFFACLAVASAAEAEEAALDADRFFESAERVSWKPVFSFDGSEDWREHWFLDGLKAEVKSGGTGLEVVAGPTRDDDASHAVLWTKREFEGDIRIDYDYTRLDSVTQGVTILYLHATGKGEEPYVSDIAEWSQLREVPAMRVYFNNMKALHVSYAAYDMKDDIGSEYIHARQYPTGAGRSFVATGFGDRIKVDRLIEPGKTYRVTILKIGDKLLFSSKEKGTGERKSFLWDASDRETLDRGRIGLRHMWTRSARYESFTVSERNDG